jgi:O-antigen ligase
VKTRQRTWRNVQNEWFVRLLLLVSVVFATTSFLRVTTYYRVTVGVVFVAALVAARFIRRPQPSPAAGWFVAYLALLSVAFARFAWDPIDPIPGPVVLGHLATLLGIATFAWFVLLADGPPIIMAGRLRCALLAPIVFAWANIGLFILGIDIWADPASANANSGKSTVLGLFGLTVNRASLPLVPGINGSGVAAAVALVVAVMLRDSEDATTRRVAWATLPVAVMTIALTDSRGALILAFAAIVILNFVPRWGARAVVIVPALLPIAPILILYLVTKLAGIAGGLSRRPGDFATATGRQDVWSVIFEFLSHPTAEHLWGYGAYGQAASEVGYRYAYIFNYNTQPAFGSTQNTVLQMVLDSGYLGALVLLGIMVAGISAAATAWRRSGYAEHRALLAGLVVIALLGSTEAAATIFSPPTLLAFILLTIAAMREPIAQGGPERAAAVTLPGSHDTARSYRLAGR